MSESPITFSFGKNWIDYQSTISEEVIRRARADLTDWLGEHDVAGKRVLDIGSGSGIHSLGFHQLGAADLLSVDVDPHSVQATRQLWEKCGSPQNWTVAQHSILDEQFVNGTGQFDIVYSWGVLHHTGDTWKAIDNSLSLLKPGGRYFISLYADGPNYQKHLQTKQKFNAASALGKKWMIYARVLKMMLLRAKQLRNPFGWNERRGRGMSTYYDLVDWLGGLPYEVVGVNELLTHLAPRGLFLERTAIRGEGSCNVYLFRHLEELVRVA